MKKNTGIIGILILIIAVIISGCTTSDQTSNDTQTTTAQNNSSSFNSYDNNSVMSFQYPKEWKLDYVSSDSRGVYFNSSNGEIRIQLYQTQSSNSQQYTTGKIGNWSYKLYEENNNNIYVISLSNGGELLVRGPIGDNEGLQKVIETLQLY